jgi:hypothetical protein
MWYIYVCATCVHVYTVHNFQSFKHSLQQHIYIFNIYYIYVCILHCIHVIYIIYTVCTRYMYVVHVLHVLHTYTCGYTYHIHVYTVYTRTPTLSMHNNFTLKSVLFNFRLKYSASLFLLRRVLPQLFEEV